MLSINLTEHTPLRPRALQDGTAAASTLSPLLTQPPPTLTTHNDTSRGTSGMAAGVLTAACGDGGAASSATHTTTMTPAAAPALRARSFTAARRSSLLLAAAGSEVAYAVPQLQLPPQLLPSVHGRGSARTHTSPRAVCLPAVGRELAPLTCQTIPADPVDAFDAA